MKRGVLFLALALSVSLCAANDPAPTPEEASRALGGMVSSLAHKMRACARHYPARFKEGADLIDAHINKEYPRLAVAMVSAPWANIARETGEFSVYTVESDDYRNACRWTLDAVRDFIAKRNPEFNAYVDSYWR